METDDLGTLLDSDDTAGELDLTLLVLLEKVLDMLDKDDEIREEDDEIREEDIVCVLLDVAELCGLDEPEPDPPPQAVKYMLSRGSIKNKRIFIDLLQSFLK